MLARRNDLSDDHLSQSSVRDEPATEVTVAQAAVTLVEEEQSGPSEQIRLECETSLPDPVTALP